MSKVTLNSITSGFASTTLLNANFATLATAIENTLSRDGTTPNTMSADLDMNGNRILNILAQSGDGFTWEGTWLTSTAYIVNNLVATTGRTYICTVAHTSGTFATDLAAGKWELLADKGATGAGTGDMLTTNNLSDVTSAATARTNLGLAIGTNVQAYDADIPTVAASQGEMEAGTEAALRSMSPLRVAQAIAALPATVAVGGVVKVVEATPYTTYSSTAVLIPYDNSIPTDTEGAQWASVTITPASATNTLRITATYDVVSAQTAYEIITAAIFQSGTTTALAVSLVKNESAADSLALRLTVEHVMVAGTASAVTFTTRAGGALGTIYINGNSVERKYGGISAVRMRVTEIKV